MLITLVNSEQQGEPSERQVLYVRQLGNDDLCHWLKTQLEEDEWNDAEPVIRKLKIKGNNFLENTWKNGRLLKDCLEE